MRDRLLERLREIGADYSLNGENGVLITVPYGFRVGFMEELRENFRISENCICRLESDSFGNAREILVVIKEERRDIMFSARERFYFTYVEIGYEYDEETMGDHEVLFDSVLRMLLTKLHDEDFELDEEETEMLATVYSIIELNREAEESG